MTLDAALRTALSGLQTSQTVLQTTSANVANVNTPGYARQVAEINNVVVAGNTAGVEVTEIRRIVDQFIQREILTATASTGFYQTQETFHSRLQAVLGDPQSDHTLNNLIDDVFQSFSSLAVDPSQTARRLSALESLRRASQEISRIADQVQTLRENADNQIAANISSINISLEKIFTLNSTIASEIAAGREAPGLQDQRDRLIEDLSSILDIRALPQPNGMINITTAGGVVLIDSRLRELDYNAVGSVDTSSTFDDIQVYRVDPITGQRSLTTADFGSTLRTGEIRALIDLRDQDLPDIAQMLGQVAAEFIDRINGTHNAYSAVPAPNSLTGRDVGALATDPHGFTGEATFAVMDANNEISDSFTVDFSAYTTLADVIAAVNSNVTGGTLALTNGVMSFTAANANNGVVIQQDSADPSDRGGRGFSHYFGMNDLLTGRSVPNYDTGLVGSTTHGFGSSGTVTIQLRGASGDITTTHVLDFASVGSDIDAIITDLNTNFSPNTTFALDGNGRLTTTNAAGFENHYLHVMSDTTSRGSTSLSFGEFFGVGRNRVMDPAFNMDVNSRFMNDSTALSLATLDLAAASGTPALTIGDNTGAIALHDLQDVTRSVDATGNIPQVNATLSAYTNLFLSTVAIESQNVEGFSGDFESLRSDLIARRDSTSGVNLDEELANMIIYQQSYNAAARIITTVNRLFDTLLNITN